MHKCPKCGSKEVIFVDEDLGFIQCKKCGFNELEDMNYFSEKNSQREKTKFNPYKTGGHKRID